MTTLRIRLSDDVAVGALKFCGDLDHASRVVDLMLRKALRRWEAIEARHVGRPRTKEEHHGRQ